MKQIKLRIVGLCFAVVLVFFGAYTIKSYANEPGGPQNPKPAPKTPSSTEVDPNHCGGCYILWLLGF